MHRPTTIYLRKWLVWLIGLLVGGLFWSSQPQAEEKAPHLAQQLDQILWDWIGDQTPGGVVGILRSGRVILQRAYGMASLEYEVPITLDTIFNAGSIAKQFTALAIIRLAEQGKLRLDDEIRTHIPDFPDFGTPIYISHLLFHISGLRDFQSLLAMGGWRYDDTMTREDAMALVRRQRELNFPPGSEFLYGNMGHVILAEIVERVSGESFVDWTKQQIFCPLGMYRTAFREDLEAIHTHTAASYFGSVEEGFLRAKEWWHYGGSGGIYTNLGDLLTWIGVLRSPPTEWREAITKLQQRGRLTSGESIDYAAGLVIDRYRGHRIIHHGGGVGGYMSFLGYLPDEDLGIVVLSNFSASDPRAKALAILDLFLQPETARPDPTPVIPSESVDVDPRLLTAYGGWYQLNERPDVLLWFGLIEKTFTLRVNERADIGLIAKSDRVFSLADSGTEITFHRDEKDGMKTLSLQEKGQIYRGRRIPPPSLTARELQEWEGVYYSPELETSYRLRAADGVIHASHPKHRDFILKPTLTADYLKGPWFFQRVKAMRDTEGRIVGLCVSGQRVRNVKFIKREESKWPDIS